jgi:methyl-accepting chemotaxis protein
VWLAAFTVAAALLGGVLASWLTARLLRPLGRIQRLVGDLLAVLPPPPGNPARADAGAWDLELRLDDLGLALARLLEELGRSTARLTEEASDMRSGLARRGAAIAGQGEALRRAKATAAAMAEVTREAAGEAGSVIALVQRAEMLSGQGLDAVEQAIRSAGDLGEQVRRISATMGDLSERTLQVGEIVASVKDLAEQSNLLALNASIEAAKSGEHGRGFAAVAMEMRTLAEQSRQAAVQVRSILGEIQKHAGEAALATEEGSTRAALATARSRSAGDAIEGLAQVIRGSAGSARTIAERNRQQAAGVAELVEAIAELSSTLQDGAEDSSALEAHAAEVAALASRLAALPGG